jgi:thioredoxin-like negative regulator of GroEL
LKPLRPALERARAAAPGSIEIKRRLQMTYSALGENRALAGLLLEDAAGEADPTARFSVLMSAARLLVDPKLGDPGRAMTVLNQARAINADDPETGILLADALMASGKKGEALDLLEQLVAGQKRRSKPRSAMHRRIARLYMEMGAKSTALQSLVRAMEDDPHDPALAMEVGFAAVEQNDADAMQRAFRTVTLMKTVKPGAGGGATATEKATAYYHLARVAQMQGDLRKARLIVEKSLAEAKIPDALALRDELKG